MSIYTKARAKITLSTVIISLSVVVGLWLCAFITDYIMYRNNMPGIFSMTKVTTVNDERITYEQGLGYNVKTVDGKAQMYLLGYEI